MNEPILRGRHVILEPLRRDHLDGLVAAAAADPSLYRWTTVPQSRETMAGYIETALAARDSGNAVPFATLLAETGQIIGSTRFFDLARWPWPPGHSLHGRSAPDTCEIGYTWLTRSAIRTPANTEAKLLMLAHAFESWQVQRVCFHTDARNERSRAALERLGAKFEGILRSHRMASDFIPRDSVCFSIIASEWPSVKQRLDGYLNSEGRKTEVPK